MKSPIHPDSDRPLEAVDEDQFGFVEIAERLAPALLKARDGDGLVVGLEGSWGSGKTTLLNYLRTELSRVKAEDVHIISLAPWLNGDTSNLVASLIEPIADVVESVEQTKDSAKNKPWWKAKKKRDDLGNLMRSYGAKTGRTLAPAARFAEYFIPGAKVASDALVIGSDYLDQSLRHPTTAETKAKISQKIKELGISFVVILDDLDRLEPAQAVEVVRLVRSVADFPRVTYLMCYDREILSHALSHGLNLENGDLFLQKIVQLTFAIPLPEPFDLRRKFFDDALKIFSNVTGANAEDQFLDELKNAIDHEGAGLQTPREVKLALNGIRFMYPAVYEDVYFPDVCRIQLIKVINRKLYKWLEEYLSTRSVLVSGDAFLGDDEKTRLGEQLLEIMPSNEVGSTRSIRGLSRFIPGVVSNEDPKDRVFSSSNVSEVRDMVAMRRLGSPFHYRFYFALTPPKTVLPDEEFASLLGSALEDPTKLTEELVGLANERRTPGTTWFEHVLDRLDEAKTGHLDGPTAHGLVLAISDAMDTVLANKIQPGAFLISIERKAGRVVERCLRQLKTIDIESFQLAAKHLAISCPSLNWVVGTFFRDQIWAHGLVGDQAKPPESWIFSAEELEATLGQLRKRVADEESQSKITDMPDIANYLFGWRDLVGVEIVKAWAEEFSTTDEDFLKLLQSLRTWAMSDKVFYPLRKSSVSAFLSWEETVARLERLKDSEYSETVSELKNAINQATDW